MESSIKRLAIIDYLKAFFIICVILDHTKVMEGWNPFYLFVVRMAVPFFIMMSGYTFSLCVKENEFRKMYDFNVLLKRFFRFTIPIVITYIGCLVILFLRGNTLSFSEIMSMFLLGNFGQGGYYYMIMLQFILVFPLLYQIVYKLEFCGVVLIGFANFFFEVLCTYYQINKEIYDILIMRYILLIGLGIWLCLNQNKTIKSSYLILSLGIGSLYLLLPGYFGYEYRVFTYWSNTSMVVSFLVYPLFYVALKYFNNLSFCGIIGSVISQIGKASYHIMCTQLLWFKIRNRVYGLVIFSCENELLKVCFDIFISVICGIVFCLIDNKIFNKLYCVKKVQIAK